MICPRCGENLILADSEIMGEDYLCKCGAEFIIPFDKRPAWDGVQKPDARDDGHADG